MCERPIVPLTVKPRKPVTVTTGVTFSGPYLVVRFRPCPDSHPHDEMLFVEETGEILPASDLPMVTLTSKPFIYVARSSGISLVELNEFFEDDQAWQFRLTPHDREIWKPNRPGKPTIVRQVIINFFGFRKGYGRKENLYHQVLDPDLFLHRFGLDDIVPGDMCELEKLRTWAMALREWAVFNGLKLQPTSGSLAAQLLRDARFYPNDRRKVPRPTNARARDVLPGNYYLLRAEERKQYPAIYIDQVSAHHTCAASISLPDADRLYAKGCFHDLSKGRLWAKRGTRLYERAIRQHGLFYLAVTNPQDWKKTSFPLPCQQSKGPQHIFVWSNEVDYLIETGTQVWGIIAAWTSDRVDTGIPRYAHWALSELRTQGPNSAWLKPTLLSAYGILAAAPRRFETAYRRSDTGERVVYPLGGELVEVKRHRSVNTRESGTANVIHRGMIEAETRLRSLRMARDLTAAGCHVLAIYADSVFIDATIGTLPLLPSEWSIKGELTNLEFFNSVSFTSRELTKLPGIPRSEIDRIRRIRGGDARRSIRALATDDREEGFTSRRSVRPNR